MRIKKATKWWNEGNIHQMVWCYVSGIKDTCINMSILCFIFLVNFMNLFCVVVTSPTGYLIVVHPLNGLCYWLRIFKKLWSQVRCHNLICRTSYQTTFHLKAILGIVHRYMTQGIRMIEIHDCWKPSHILDSIRAEGFLEWKQQRGYVDCFHNNFMWRWTGNEITKEHDIQMYEDARRMSPDRHTPLRNTRKVLANTTNAEQVPWGHQGHSCIWNQQVITDSWNIELSRH